MNEAGSIDAARGPVTSRRYMLFNEVVKREGTAIPS